MRNVVKLSLLILLPILFFPGKNLATDYKLTLGISQIDNHSSPVVDYITPGYLMRVIFSANWASENLKLSSTKLKILIDNITVVDETHSFYDGLYQFKSTFTKQIVVPKELTPGLHKLTVTMSADGANSSKDQNLICTPATKDFWIGKPGSTSTPAKKETNINVVSKDITTPQSATFDMEVNPSTNQKWEYASCDGAGSLKILISAPGVSSVSYYLKGENGSLSKNPALKFNEQSSEKGEITLINGKGEIYYHPPYSISEERQYTTGSIPGGRTLRFYSGDITFTIAGAGGNKQEYKKEVKFCRVPVFLIHGFTGDKSTWEELGKMLNQKGFMTNRENYYAVNELTGSMDIAAQAFFLGDKINEELKVLQNANVKLSKVDLVCHSMGGLMARYYATIHQKRGEGVRKLIMVGTPNHGIYSAADLMTGKMAAIMSNSHKGMAQEVDAKSAVIQKINQSESSGGHLNKSIEYGNIYVEGTDGVVEGRSARLNGVQEVILNSMKHSPSIPDSFGYGNKSITTDWTVFGKILSWLQNPIPAASLNMNKWDMAGEVTAGKNIDLTGKGHIMKVSAGSILFNTHLRRLECSADGKAEIQYPDGSVVSIMPGSKISFNENMNELVINTGKMILNLRKQNNSFKVITPSLTAGVKGTYFEVVVENGGKCIINLFEGELEITNLSGTKTLKSGQTISALNEKELIVGTSKPVGLFGKVNINGTGMIR